MFAKLLVKLPTSEVMFLNITEELFLNGNYIFIQIKVKS